jgi:hypothetical protein
MVTNWIPQNVIFETFIPMFGGRDSTIIPSNKLFIGNLHSHVHGHPIPKKRKLKLELSIPSGYNGQLPT